MLSSISSRVSTCLFLAAAASAQDATLVLGTPVAGELGSGASDQYFITADAGQFVAGTAHQLGVDVVVTITGPGGEVVGKFDGPGVGPEPFSFQTESAGKYGIEVAAFEEDAGNYSVVLQLLEPIADQGEGRVDQLMAAFTGTGTPGGVVLVVQDGKILLEKAYGMANLVHGIPFSTSTPSNLGSTSKQFTAFAILMLEASGKLSLDDDIRKHIPELPDLGETITLRHLLTHTSGLREFINTLLMSGRNISRGDFVDRAESLAVAKRQPSLQSSPGAQWTYNNTGYCLLSYVVERTTGESFPDWMEANVFAPLGMENTTIRSDPSQLIPGSSQGYSPSALGFMDARDIGGSMGAGGIYSTTGDLAKWIRNLQTGAVGGKPMIEAMMTENLLTSGKSMGYGFGFFIDRQGQLLRVHHGGADTAHRAILMTYPTIEAGVVVLSNHAGCDAEGIASKVALGYFGAEIADDQATGPKASAKANVPAAEPAEFSPKDFDDCAGSYALDAAPAFIMRFFKEGDAYMTQATGQPKLAMKPTGPMTFTLVDVEASVTFKRNADGKVDTVILNQGGEHTATRVEEENQEPDAEELKRFVGRYFSEELGAIYYVKMKDGALVLNHRRKGDEKMVQASAHEFVAGRNLRMVFTLQDEGPAQGFALSDSRTHGVSFVRL